MTKALGKLLLAMFSPALAAGLEPKRALREATRELRVELRSFELDSDSVAVVTGSYLGQFSNLAEIVLDVG
jgi:hypothetical protein